MSQPLGCGTWINHKWEVLRPRRSRIAALFARAGAHTHTCLWKCLQARSFVYRARHHNSKQALNPESTLFASLRLLRSNPSERVVFVVVRIADRTDRKGTGLFVDAFVLNCAKSPQLSNARCLPVPKMPKGPPAPGRGEWDGVSPRRFRLKTVLHISYKSALVRVTWCWQRGGFWNNPSRGGAVLDRYALSNRSGLKWVRLLGNLSVILFFCYCCQGGWGNFALS